MKVEILSSELIKPCTPTPPSLKKYKISLLDELALPFNIPLILYYPAPNGPQNERGTNISKYSFDHLKISLAETLTKFYPLAGRYMKDSYSVDCSDQGAKFVQAKVDIRLDDLLSQRPNLSVEELYKFLPTPVDAVDKITDPLLAVQVNIFDCYGLAIGLCVSHKVADMSTVGTFIRTWALTASRVEGVDAIISPIFNSTSYLSGGKGLPGLQALFPMPKESTEHHKFVTKMFHFNKAAISSIQAKVRQLQAGSNKSSKPSRVQSVFGVVWKALVDINVSKDGKPRDYLALEIVNLRERTVSPFPKYSFGNLCTLAKAKHMASERETEVQGLVDLLSESVKHTVSYYGDRVLDSEEGEMMIINGCKALIEACSNNKMVPSLFSSWCNFPFYEADFGWGKPIWISTVSIPIANMVILIDGKDGDGIEAWISLEDKDMLNLESNSNIRCFAN